MESGGMGADGIDSNHQTKVDIEQVEEIAKCIDGKHSKGESVVARHIIFLLLDMYGIHIHRWTVGRLVAKLGLTWSRIRPVQKTFAAHRKKVLREYLITFDEYKQKMREDDCEYIYVFTDESYVNTGNGMTKSYIPSDIDKDSGIKKKSGKGRGLIILHAITVDGSLAAKNETGNYVDEMKW